MPDMEKVIKGLEMCIKDIECTGCPYENDCFAPDDNPFGASMMRDALALLKKQEEQKFFVDESGKVTPLPVVVRCKDCKHRGDKHKCIVAFVAEKQEMPYFFYDNRGEWYCADGERK